MISIPVRPQYHNPNRSKNPSTWSKRESTGFPLTVIPCPLLNRWYAKPVIPIDQSHNEIYLRRVDIPCNSIEYPGLKNKHACMYTHTHTAAVRCIYTYIYSVPKIQTELLARRLRIQPFPRSEKYVFLPVKSGSARSDNIARSERQAEIRVTCRNNRGMQGEKIDESVMVPRQRQWLKE